MMPVVDGVQVNAPMKFLFGNIWHSYDVEKLSKFKFWHTSVFFMFSQYTVITITNYLCRHMNQQ